MSHYEELKQRLQRKQYVWLVTGAAGFIGSHLTEALLKLNQKVVGMDNLSTGFKKNLDHVLSAISAVNKDNFTFIEADIRSEIDCKLAVNGSDYVLHHAAVASVPDSINNPLLTNAVNVDGFLNILCAARDAGVKRVVYASSSAVYGDVAKLPIKEKDVSTQLSPYAVSKYVNELYALTFAKCYKTEAIGLRYFNVFGPRQDPNGAYAAVIPRWISALINNEPVTIFGDGETSRDFCYIENIIQANLLAACSEAEGVSNTVYNIATGQQITLKQLHQLLSRILKIDLPATYQDFRPGDIRHSIASIEKAHSLLKYSPTHSLQQGLIDALPWYSL